MAKGNPPTEWGSPGPPQGPFKTTIAWGTTQEVVETYTFATYEEWRAFMYGVDQASGWLEYEVQP